MFRTLGTSISTLLPLALTKIVDRGSLRFLVCLPKVERIANDTQSKTQPSDSGFPRSRHPTTEIIALHLKSCGNRTPLAAIMRSQLPELLDGGQRSYGVCSIDLCKTYTPDTRPP